MNRLGILAPFALAAYIASGAGLVPADEATRPRRAPPKPEPKETTRPDPVTRQQRRAAERRRGYPI